MPSRLVSVAILLFWAFAVVGLIARDVLPDLLINEPPDLKSIAAAGVDERPSRWAILVADDPSLKYLRSVGQAVTETKRMPGGAYEMNSTVWFDSADLLKGTPFATGERMRFEVTSLFEIDPSGDLKALQAKLHAMNVPEEPLLEIDGVYNREAKTIDIKTKGPHPLLNRTKSFPYQSRGLVQNALGPLDRLPGLQVGQRWDMKIVSPLTGRVEAVQVEVPRTHVIHWNNSPVTTLEVVQKMSPFSAKTWVRRDGLVLRQEVPFPFVKLILERQP